MCRNLYEQATAKDIRADRRKKVSQVKNRNIYCKLLSLKPMSLVRLNYQAHNYSEALKFLYK